MKFFLAFIVSFASILHWSAIAQTPGTHTASPREDVRDLGKRVALVIGNSDYKNTSRLENPKHDAEDVGAVLKKIGFQVIEGRDLDKAGMDRLIRDFAEALAGARVGLLFYAGHGLQVGGQNYLVPVDAKLTTSAALDFEMVRLDLIHRTMERETSTNIIILDACRDNPLGRNLARALGTRSMQVGRGLAAVESGEGTLISFSTQPGNVALDGKGRNSPFAQALVAHIAEPGQDLPSLLINVRNDVMRSTERRQVPWEHSALTAKFYFVPPTMTIEQQIETTYWDAVKHSEVPGPIASYLERYPNGANAALARALIEQLEKKETAERAARDAEQKRLEAELKRLEEARKASEAQRLEALKKADDLRKSAEAQAHAPQAAGPGSGADDEAKRHDEQLRALKEELERTRKSSDEMEAQRKAAEKRAADAMQAAATARASLEAEASRRGETKLAMLPPEPAQPQGPFDGSWRMTVSSPNCAIKSARVAFHVRDGRLDGKRKGTISPSGRAEWREPAVADGAPIIYRGTFKGSTGSGTFERQDGRCSGTFTATKQ